ncbi:uncharacterized protein LOC111870179 isoform X2 [Cryptotermes secundus]|uniref:uncharacterized protein LOC111870179 isoform X2 n=1 Tax=Cryptotermes secundus TaxID=105785 RepID=UPI000CD7B948|nr:uncharacterized protein LOC111870179 isoform X2 [Cryptotermes secundus]
MSLKPSRRSLHVVPKAKLGELQPLPEPVEEMAVEVEETPVSFHRERLLETHITASMLSALQLDGTASENSAPSLSREESFYDIFGFDSADDGDQGRSWQFSDGTESSGFGNSVTSFMSWSDDVEVETTRTVQELIDELERCFYGEESLNKLKKEVAEECFDWRSKFPHYRVRGAGIDFSSLQLQTPYKKIHVDDKVTSDEAVCVVLEDNGDSEEEEVIASHGSYQENLEPNDGCNRNDNSRPNTAEGSAVMCYTKDISTESLRQKVKDCVMEQLFSHVWSEVSRSLEPLLHLYSENISQQRPSNAASLQGQRRMNTPTLAAADIPFIPVSDICDSELNCMLSVSAKSVRCSARRALVSPMLELGLECDESVMSQLARTGVSVDPVKQPRESQIVSLPKPLSLHSANHVLGPTPTLESRGYHSAADRRTWPMLNRRLSSITSGRETFLRPLEEQQTVAAKVTTTSRQVSAPASPPSWSRYVTLPPIDRLDPRIKGLSSLHEPKIRSFEVSPKSRTSAKQKGLDSTHISKTRSPKASPKSKISSRTKISLLPAGSSGPISIQGIGLPKTDIAKQMLEIHEDLSFEKKNGIMSSAKDRRCKWNLRDHSHVN